MTHRTLVVAGTVVASLLAATQAFAHAELVSSDPAAGSQAAAPATITLVFSDEIVGQFSGFEVTDTHHDVAVPVETALAEDGKTIVGTPEEPLAAGHYTVSWHVASDDGHRETGEVSFEVK